MADTKTGLEERVACILCYVLGWVTGIIFLILEPENKTIKFHAFQSILVFASLHVIIMIFAWIPIIGWIIATLVGIVAFIAWISLMVLASQEKKYKVPIAGEYAEKWAG
jgi:uncharacterized membrane protein